MKKSLIIVIALALLACVAGLVWFGLRPDDLNNTGETVETNTSAGPSFEVRVVVPRMGRPLGGILPDWLVRKLDGTPGELRVDHTSRDARIVSVKPDRLELSAEGWNLFIEADGEGRITPATHLVFPLALGGRHVRLDCRPADRATGFLRTKTRQGSGETDSRLDGRFVVELATCKNADSGKAIEWPPAPLILRGSFADLSEP